MAEMSYLPHCLTQVEPLRSLNERKLRELDARIGSLRALSQNILKHKGSVSLEQLEDWSLTLYNFHSTGIEQDALSPWVLQTGILFELEAESVAEEGVAERAFSRCCSSSPSEVQFTASIAEVAKSLIYTLDALYAEERKFGSLLLLLEIEGLASKMLYLVTFLRAGFAADHRF